MASVGSAAELQTPLSEDEICAFLYEEQRYAVTLKECKKTLGYRIDSGFLHPKSVGRVVPSEMPEVKKIIHETVARKRWMLENDLLEKPPDNPHVYARELEFESYLSKILEQMPIEVSEEEIEQYYERYRQALNTPKMTKIKCMNIIAEESELTNDRQTTLEQCKSIAMEALKRVQRGEDFDQVMKEVSPEGWQGNLDFQPQGPRGLVVDLAVAKLKVGQVSQPIPHAQGYYLIKLIAVQPSRPLTLEEAKPRIENVLRSLAYLKNRETLISKLSVKHIVVSDSQKESEIARLF
jgi:hypothetical protein